MKRIKRGLKRTMGFILTAGLIVSPVLSVSAEESANVETDTVVIQSKRYLGNVGASKLSGTELELYNYLKQKIQDVANGKITSTEFDVSSILDTSAKRQSIMQNNGQALQKINAYLLMDCPYECYWYDKEAGGGIGASYKNGISTITMAVSSEYRTSNSSTYVADKAKTQEAAKVTEVAKKIVEDNADKSDYEKLLAYKDAICDLVDYDFSAANSSSSTSTKPLQLISVFDGDSNTKVVCEGYSKAFQYLCDLSDFQDEVMCYTVTGNMDGGTGSGAHMWNVVRINGNSYLVDVTNSDKGAIGQSGNLFLVSAKGSPDSSYTVGGVTYVYDDGSKEGTLNQADMLGENILTLATLPYSGSTVTPNPTPTPEPTPGPEPVIPDRPDGTLENDRWSSTSWGNEDGLWEGTYWTNYDWRDLEQNNKTPDSSWGNNSWGTSEGVKEGTSWENNNWTDSLENLTN